MSTSMDTTVLCTFEQRLTTGDIGKLARLIGAVIPIPNRHHLVGSANIGLNNILTDKTADYGKVRMRMRLMTPTILRRVEGNQMVLSIPTHGLVYTVKNTTPIPWEKGDMLVAMPPIFGNHQMQGEPIVTVNDWNLILPWLMPQDLAIEINQRLILIALLSLDRSQEEVKLTTNHLRTIRYRDTVLTLPDPSLNNTALLDLRNVCIAMSMVANLCDEVTLTYVRKLALEDSSMLLTKCQELLARKEAASQNQQGQHNQRQINIQSPAIIRPRLPPNLTPAEELNKLTALFVMVRQIVDVISEQPMFFVCDISADERAAVCIFKG